MDFDEYEYLERMVEDVDLPQESNGVGGVKRKSNEDGLSRDGDSKKFKDDGYSSRRDKSDRDKDKDRDRDRDRDRNKDKDRVKDKTDKERPLERSDRDSKGREKDKERHRDRDRERYGERDRDRDREKPRDRAREHDRDRDRDRERSISKSRHHEKERDNGRSREKEKTRERDVERVRESRERVRESREREREREDARRSRERKEKEQSAPKEPEVDLERDQRTVFAYQMCLKADEHDVYEFFSRAGKVRDVRLIMDRNSRRSKGVGYIEFYDAMSVPVAIALSGQLLRGQPVMVKPSEAEKNLAQSTATPAVGSTGAYSVGARRLYVGNLHFNITEDQLRQVFEPFGTVELVQLPRDLETGHCKGFGFVQYARLEDARSAQQALNGVLELAGRIIKVSSISDQAGIPDGGIATGELDDDEGGGLSLTARSRVLLMQKLDRSGAAPSIPAPAMTAPIGNSPFGLLGSSLPNAASIVSPLVGAINPAVLPGLAGLANPLIAEPVGAPTDCLLLKNMFDPTTETEPDFDLDIKEDVQQECSKFGTIKHIFVDKHSSGHVYLRFDNVTSAMNAQRALHGRWFAGKMITTQFWTPQAYEAKFPDSR